MRETVPFALGVALSLAQTSPSLGARDAALLGVPASAALPSSLSTLPLHNAIAYSSAHHGAVIEQLVGFLCAPRAAAG